MWCNNSNCWIWRKQVNQIQFYLLLEYYYIQYHQLLSEGTYLNTIKRNSFSIWFMFLELLNLSTIQSKERSTSISIHFMKSLRRTKRIKRICLLILLSTLSMKISSKYQKFIEILLRIFGIPQWTFMTNRLE